MIDFERLEVSSRPTDERRTVTVRVVDQRQHESGPFYFGSGFVRGTLDAVLDSLAAIRESIPEEYRATACCEISSEIGHEATPCVRVRVTYPRPETDEEWAVRIANLDAPTAG